MVAGATRAAILFYPEWHVHMPLHAPGLMLSSPKGECPQLGIIPDGQMDVQLSSHIREYVGPAL